MKSFNSFYIMGLFALGLASCSSSPNVPYAQIQPIYQVRNSPIPVPWPKEKPNQGQQSRVSETQPVLYRPSGNASEAIVGRTVTVQRGDTLYSISRILGVELKALIDANNLSAPYALRLGQVLAVPATLNHTVQRGETTYGISRRFGVDMTRLVRLNHLRAPYNLALGQRLKIPTSTTSTTVANNNAPQRQATAPLPPREGSKFIWPTRGAVLSSYGPKEGGIHNDGINIRATHGAEVKAADAGVVAYAGQDIKGFGQLLLIRHEGGWVTAYAHNDALLVERGQAVRRGQKIANVGTSGGVATPQLHFEVRKGTRAVDPIRYLARR